jgi:dCMP deaminase
MTRPSWDECFLEVAHVIAKRSTCLRVPSGVGCVLVSAEHTILSAGYAGSMRGAPHCTEVGCLIVDGGCKRTVHAEQNAIASAAANGVSLRGATAYVTLSPCRACAMMLHNAGVARIVYATEYRIVDHLDELRGLGVDIPRPVGAGVPVVVAVATALPPDVEAE